MYNYNFMIIMTIKPNPYGNVKRHIKRTRIVKPVQSFIANNNYRFRHWKIVDPDLGCY